MADLSVHSMGWLNLLHLIEFALRERFAPGKTGQKGDFRRLLQKAIKQGLLRDEGFSYVRWLRQYQKEEQWLSEQTDAAGFQLEPAGSYLRILEEIIPDVRNLTAHPQHQAIVFPQEALFAIGFAAEFINQLYSGGVGGAARSK
jgi:hypothetical protein